MRRPCIEHGCQLLAPEGHSRCRAHEQQRVAKRNGVRRSRAHPTRGAAAQLRAGLNTQGYGRCQQCGTLWEAGQLEADHIRALADGGDDTPGNVQALCIRCHRAKTGAENKARAQRR